MTTELAPAVQTRVHKGSSSPLGASVQHGGVNFSVFSKHAYWEPLTFELPPLPPGGSWRRCIDTALPLPDDIRLWVEAPPITSTTYMVQPRTVALLAVPFHASSTED